MDVTKPDPDAEGVVMQQSYPSPMVDSADAQYYQLANHREHDGQMTTHQGGQDVPDGLPNLAAHQEHQEHHEDQDHHDLHELQELQDSPAPQQHDSRPQVSADELQLAAQLTQGLTQGMSQMMAPADMAAVESQVQEQPPLPQQLGEDHQQHQQQQEVQPQSVPNLQEQLEASLQSHERELQNRTHTLQAQNHDHELQSHSHELQGHEHELQAHNHELQNHELQVQNVMPHHEQTQTQHHFSQNPPPPPHLPTHLSMDHMPNVHPTYQMPDTTPPRKRSKVSRACDECRRKKIKCDAQSEASEQACSNCRRSSAQCLFSRVPQKRGPSKGYIKELADRINSIEGKLNSNVTADGLEDTTRRSSTEAFASPVLGDDSRKRPFSSISADPYASAGSPSRIQTTYGTEHRPILPYVHPDFRPPNPASANDLALKNMPPLPTFPTGSDLGIQSRSADGLMDSISPNGTGGPANQPDQQQQQLPEIDDAVFNKYLQAIHPTFPILASTRPQVQSLLWQVSFALQTAFHQAFFAMMRPFSPGVPAGDMMAASRLLHVEQSQGRRPPVENMLRLQVLTMLVIASDCQGASGGTAEWKTEILAQAVGLGYMMGLHAKRASEEVGAEGFDTNADENVALRGWWVLVMLDRWAAVGSGRPTMVANNTVVVLPGLRFLVDEAVLGLIRLSHVLGFLVSAMSNPRGSSDPFTTGPTTQLTEDVILIAREMARLSFPTGGTATPALQLAYWHIQVLFELLTTSRSPQRILEACKNSVSILANNTELICPLTHHFVTLVGVALVELCKLEEVEEQAVELVGIILDYGIAGSTWNEAVRRKLDTVRRHRGGNNSRRKTLQQLADLATTSQGQRSQAWIAAEETGKVLREGGYLAFWGDNPDDQDDVIDEHSQEEEHHVEPQSQPSQPQQSQPQDYQPQEAVQDGQGQQEDVVMHDGPGQVQQQSQEEQENAAAHAAAAAAVAAMNGVGNGDIVQTIANTTATSPGTEPIVAKAEEQSQHASSAEAELGLGLQLAMNIPPTPSSPAAV
ncbi:hypothetical protein QBC40DRAFT_305875 [Triangularia verruculosa]|uniref:Zn(2)-C6 fungal-type domain-containing protein n=1 Tax=Triangularia verruculosa TaxID=2587418 RepID=A0AAN6XJP8_9PEZI|nr:hypothetical protein QBC40DRAFT_305875 [Triangularia verruculosa]